MLVVAGLAYVVKADTEDEAETKLLDFLNAHTPHEAGNIEILKIWVSARQNNDERVKDMEEKEREHLK